MEQLPLDLGDSEEENRKKRVAEAKAKVKELAEEHRATAKDERTYKRFGEPVSRGGGTMPKSNRDITKNYKAGGKVKKVKKMAFGGLPTQAAPQAAVGMANRPAMPSQAGAGMTGLDRAAAMSGRAMPPTGRPMKKGGTASARADGIAKRGKTRGTIKMCGGGKY